MATTKIKTERTMEMQGNWTDAIVSVKNHVCSDYPPELAVSIEVAGSQRLYLIHELRAILAFAESEVARIECEWEAAQNA